MKKIIRWGVWDMTTNQFWIARYGGRLAFATAAEADAHIRKVLAVGAFPGLRAKRFEANSNEITTK